MNATIFTPAGSLYLLLGVVLFCAGTLLGIPHGLAKRRGDAKRVELWRVAHLSTCVGGVSLIALTVALERLFEAAAAYTLVPFSAAAYTFFLACTLSGWLNKAWDDDQAQASVAFIYGLQMFASALSVVAVGGFLVTLFLKIMS
jgi:membrane glycosyltransferase